ncbi:hypothetical protein OE88DRAFT_106836 [Heliocybe sulcata]|uniref:Uncharacterized protein n=1 Tax=Heliocybe sulcata TaxID=5364 RepID=A0A5C3NH21_9AGAM|nr:hypothetical protein OE88DRAFT_106836 [Heliocybe sulcata]
MLSPNGQLGHGNRLCKTERDRPPERLVKQKEQSCGLSIPVNQFHCLHSSMPSSTAVYEVLFEFDNDDTHSVALSIPYERAGGTTVWLDSQEIVKLVCTAGTTYRYVVRRGRQEAELSVQVWADTTCKTSDAFPSSRRRHSTSWSPLRGVTIATIVQ